MIKLFLSFILASVYPLWLNFNLPIQRVDSGSISAQDWLDTLKTGTALSSDYKILSFSYDNSKPKLFGKIFFTEQKFFALEEIDLSGHNLTAVNVNNLINLKSLKVDNNLLAEPLNLQTLPNLTYFSAFREKASESSLQVLLPAWFVPYTSWIFKSNYLIDQNTKLQTVFNHKNIRVEKMFDNNWRLQIFHNITVQKFKNYLDLGIDNEAKWITGEEFTTDLDSYLRKDYGLKNYYDFNEFPVSDLNNRHPIFFQSFVIYKKNTTLGEYVVPVWWERKKETEAQAWFDQLSEDVTDIVSDSQLYLKGDVNLSRFSHLKSLNINDNGITNLDLSTNFELLRLQANHNKLSKIDLSHTMVHDFLGLSDNKPKLNIFLPTFFNRGSINFTYDPDANIIMTQPKHRTGNNFVKWFCDIDEEESSFLFNHDYLNFKRLSLYGSFELPATFFKSWEPYVTSFSLANNYLSVIDLRNLSYVFNGTGLKFLDVTGNLDCTIIFQNKQQQKGLTFFKYDPKRQVVIYLDEYFSGNYSWLNF